jgi:hypothetical protein
MTEAKLGDEREQPCEQCSAIAPQEHHPECMYYVEFTTPDSEPVAWRWRTRAGDNWTFSNARLSLNDIGRTASTFQEEPLFTSPAADVRAAAIEEPEIALLRSELKQARSALAIISYMDCQNGEDAMKMRGVATDVTMWDRPDSMWWYGKDYGPRVAPPSTALAQAPGAAHTRPHGKTPVSALSSPADSTLDRRPSE